VTAWAVKAALTWTAGEVAIVTLPMAVYGLHLIRRGRSLSPEALVLQEILAAMAMGVLVVIVCRRARREGRSARDFNYRTDVRAIAAGVLSALLLLPVIDAADRLDTLLVPSGRRTDEVFVELLRGGGLPVAALHLTVAGIWIPIAEEFGWRGYIQSAMTGTRGVILTALLFAAKHVIAGVTISRTVGVLVGSFALCTIGARWGTASSTVAHILLNVIAVSWSIVLAWR
jgi:membrane protease YdiL (CAAX protease family)